MEQSTSTPCNFKVILQTIIVNFSLWALSLMSVYDPSVGPWGGKRGLTELALCGLSGSSMCHGKENMSPVTGLFKVSFQRLPSRFNAFITGWSGPKLVTNRKSLLILVFPNDAKEFSIFPLSSWLHFLQAFSYIVCF